MSNGAGAVDVSSNGVVATQKDNSIGIEAQSIGGGGGNGGFSLASPLTMNDNAVGTPTGGMAGNGGAASTVSVASEGFVDTAGNQLAGIMAQSLGGGGGNGGFAIGASLSYGGSASLNAVGGNGGLGNSAGAVTVSTQATAASPHGMTVMTGGDGSPGILAQSVGGGGGNGGFSIGASASAGSDAANNAVGGNGGTVVLGCGRHADGARHQQRQHPNLGPQLGRHRGPVDQRRRRQRRLFGRRQRRDIGFLGQSVGGGRPRCYKRQQHQRRRIVDHTGTIMTAGDQSDAILAQSIGGGGGNGGFAIAGALSTGGATASTATGGAGGGGTPQAMSRSPVPG